jgi:hypothetical protein
MKITKQQLKQIIKEELEKTLNEISPQTQFLPGGFKGIEKMASRASWALDNLEQKFEGEPPQEIYTIQKFIEAIKKTSLWSLGADVAQSALHQMSPSEYRRQYQRLHTPAYKRDELQEGWKEMVFGGAMAIASLLPTSQAEAAETAQLIDNMPRQEAIVAVSNLTDFYQDTYSLNDRIRAADILGRMREKDKPFVDRIIKSVGLNPSEVKSLLGHIKDIKVSGSGFYIKLGAEFKRDDG